ncbi:Cas3: CRISPR-associated helicase/endonuclease Cas3 [Desulfosarcina variabilis str. Montpellier]
MTEEKPYFKYWGKADRGDPDRYHCLVYHCLDVAAVGMTMLECHDLLRHRFSVATGLDDKSVKQLCTFFMAIHDIGKFSEVFQNKRIDLRQRLYGIDDGRQSTMRHDNLGYIVWKDLWDRLVCDAVFGFNANHPSEFELEDSFNRLACCATGHHGYPSKSNDGHRELSAKNYFSGRDIDTVYLFISEQWQMHVDDVAHIIESLTEDDRINQFSWWLAGLLVVCDWVGSDDLIFDYVDEPMSLEKYWHVIALPNSKKALSKCGLLPCYPSESMSLNKLSGEDFSPTPLQTLCDASGQFNEPQLWILEDITGAGKTEAAMLLVNRMMAAGQANGFYIGLPTMATADGMYRRMAGCYRRLFKHDQSPSLILAHGSRHLSNQFRASIIDIPANQESYGENEPTGTAQCIAWLADNRKKTLLADAGVGTVDQALLSILPSRHQSLRLLGLGTKILLVDEVHAHDAYVNQLLKRLLTFHAHIGGSAILLSATLPQKMRTELSQAYQWGLGSHDCQSKACKNYPLVTIVKKEHLQNRPVKASKGSIRRIPVEFIHDINSANGFLEAQSKNGRCACWIRNTVWDAIEAYHHLIQEKIIDPSKLILFHARFTLADRLRIEKEVVGAFGKTSTAADRCGKILISSQVIENSLDLCLDGMISDLAPIDAIIQRAGRLHRHQRDADGNLLVETGAADQRPAPIFHILTPEPVDRPDGRWYADFFPKAAFVYPNLGQLWLAARILKKKGEINMPFDLRELIEGVYGDPFEPVPEALLEASNVAEAEAMGMASLGKYNGLDFYRGYSFSSGQWSEEIHVPTRLGEESHIVYLAKEEDGNLVPLKKGKFAWDLSSIRMPRRKLDNLAPMMREKYQDQLDLLVQTEKRLNKYAVVVPVTEREEGKWMSEGVDGNGNTVEILYDVELGMMVGDEIRGG